MRQRLNLTSHDCRVGLHQMQTVSSPRHTGQRRAYPTIFGFWKSAFKNMTELIRLRRLSKRRINRNCQKNRINSTGHQTAHQIGHFDDVIFHYRRIQQSRLRFYLILQQ